MILDLLTFVSAAGSAIAAWAAWRAVVETRKNTQANIVNELLTEYASSEMLEDIHQLIIWKKSSPKDFAEKFRAIRQTAEDTWKDDFKNVEKARRHLTHFFNKVGTLLQLELIADNVGRKIITPWQLELYEKYCYPLDAAAAQDVEERFRRDNFDFLTRIKTAHARSSL
jgi:hypothetical protein